MVSLGQYCSLLQLLGLTVVGLACNATSSDLKSLVGRHVLVGVDLCDERGSLVQRVQAHGVVKEIDPEAGIVVGLSGGQGEIFIPPVVASFHPVPPGVYRERSTGEVIPNPDYFTVWKATTEGSHPVDRIDWSRGMEWSRPIEPQFPGEHWAVELNEQGHR